MKSQYKFLKQLITIINRNLHLRFTPGEDVFMVWIALNFVYHLSVVIPINDQIFVFKPRYNAVMNAFIFKS